MSSKLAIALGALVVIAAVTVLLYRAEEASDSESAATTVSLPTVDRDQVDTLEISASEKTPVTLVKTENGWNLTAPVQAPASATATRTALDKLAEMEVTGVAATKPAHHERLDVTEGKGIHVVAKHGDAVLTDLWIGLYRAGNTMVRQDGKDRVAMVRSSVRYAFDKDVKDWRDREVTDLEPEMITRATFESQHGTFVFERDGDVYKQVDGPRIKDFDGKKAASVVSTAASLTAVDFAPAQTDPQTVGTTEGALARVTIELAADAGATQVVLKLGKEAEPDKHYYLQREGNDTIYMVSSFVGKRLSKGPEAFAKHENDSAGSAPSGNPHAEVQKIYPKRVYPKDIH